jgi:DNA primase
MEVIMVQYSQEYIKEIIKALDSRAFLENEYEIEFVESGNNWLNCSCPFPDHNDRSPSFGYNIESDHFNCFGCGETGNLIHLVQKIESISFPAAIQKLSIAAGVSDQAEEYEMSLTVNKIRSTINDYLNRSFSSGLIGGLNKSTYLFALTDRIHKYQSKYPFLEDFFERVYRDIDDAYNINDTDKLNLIWNKIGNKVKEHAKRYMG